MAKNKRMVTFSALSVGAAVVLSVAFTNCSGPSSGLSSSISASSESSNTSSLTGKIAVTVTDSAGQIVYSDSSVANASSLNLVAGKAYQLNLSQANAVAGTAYQLVLTQTNVVSGAVQTINLSVGSNNFSVPAQGDYALQIKATTPSGMITSSSYVAAVSCANPNFTAGSLSTSAISVAAGSKPNIFNISSAGLTTSANGTAPYKCAWDFTGTGIQDTSFSACESGAQGLYSNFLGARNVSVIVKDACNTVVTVSKSLTFTSSEPSMPGNVFITGVVSNASGSAKGDARVDGLNYLATNQDGYEIVQPSYGSGNFQIYSLLNYQMPSSVQFGLVLKLKGLTDTLNISGQSGSVSAANATIDSVSLVTDQAGDQSPSITLSGSNCILSNQGAKVLFVQGQPCSSGQSGDNNSATVEVYGHYSCTGISRSGASADIQGDFDGYKTLVDNCTGGGGGGGGVSPITF